MVGALMANALGASSDKSTVRREDDEDDRSSCCCRPQRLSPNKLSIAMPANLTSGHAHRSPIHTHTHGLLQVAATSCPHEPSYQIPCRPKGLLDEEAAMDDRTLVADKMHHGSIDKLLV